MEEVAALIAGLPLAVLLGAAIPALIWILYHRVALGIALVALLFVLEACFYKFDGISLGIYIYPQDFVFFAIASAGFLRLLFSKDFPSRTTSWLLFGGLLGISLAIGIPRYGTIAGVEFREYFYFWTGTLYFMSFAVDEEYFKDIKKWWNAMSVVLVLLTMFRWVAEYFDWGIRATWQAALVDNPMRVIVAGQAYVLVQMLLICAFLPAGSGSKRNAVWIGILAAFVLLLQHRSVWLVGLCYMAVVMTFLPSQIRRRVSTPLLAGIGTLSIAAGIAVTYGDFSNVENAVTESAIKATDLDSGTQGGRIYGWGQLIGDLEPIEYVTGKPFGSGWSRFESPTSAKKVGFFPHNYYVAVLLRTGLIGLILLLATYVVAIKRLYSSRQTDSPDPSQAELLLILLIGQLIFYVPYQTGYEQSILLGAAISLAASSRRSNQVRRQLSY